MPRKHIEKLLRQPIVRYFVMAAFVVGIELGIFALMNIPLHISYLIATPASMVVAIFLNWYLSRVVVFSGSKHPIGKEFTLIMATSAVGIVIQLAVTAFFVQALNAPPIVGKFFAILTTFFWNFWVRKRYIFEFNPF
jgi:putative flippase GtrA